jgi:hypothetical protein
VIAEMAAFAEAGSLSRHQLARDRYSLEFVSSSANFARAAGAQGQLELVDFRWRDYHVETTKRIDRGPEGWLVEDPLLSAAHHLAAAEALVRRYRILTDDDGNAQRVPDAASVARAASRRLDRHCSASITVRTARQSG